MTTDSQWPGWPYMQADPDLSAVQMDSTVVKALQRVGCIQEKRVDPEPHLGRLQLHAPISWRIDGAGVRAPDPGGNDGLNALPCQLDTQGVVPS